MSIVFWDTPLFIYLIEQKSNYEKVKNLRIKMIENKDIFVTSTLTLGELLTKPFQMNRLDLANQYRQLLTSKAVEMVEFDAKVAENYAKIRAKFTRQEIAPPDAIQLACASAFGVDIFYTNDNRLTGKTIDGIGLIKSIQEFE
ncbi:MAG: PIN domain-containing protein [Elusimicrobiota bacterium]